MESSTKITSGRWSYFRGLGFRFWKFLVVTLLVRAGDMRPQGFKVFVDQIGIGALRTSPVDRFVPGDEFTIGIFIAAIENPPTGPARNHFSTATQGTFDPEGYGLSGFAFGIFGTSKELTETPHFDNHIG